MESQNYHQPDPEKVALIQNQLSLMLHANKCIRREAEDPNMDCQTIHCKTMVEALRHLSGCNNLVNCTVPHCSSSREIIKHWRQCMFPDCPVCSPLKQAQQAHAVTDSGANACIASTSIANAVGITQSNPSGE